MNGEERVRAGQLGACPVCFGPTYDGVCPIQHDEPGRVPVSRAVVTLPWTAVET